jgi:hypothetical protein
LISILIDAFMPAQRTLSPSAMAIVLTNRRGEAAATFVLLAAAAEARMTLLGSA